MKRPGDGYRTVETLLRFREGVSWSIYDLIYARDIRQRETVAAIADVLAYLLDRDGEGCV